MSEMYPEDIPGDPFLDPQMIRDLKMMYQLYACAIQAGFPEQRAFELTRDIFLSQVRSAMKNL